MRRYPIIAIATILTVALGVGFGVALSAAERATFVLTNGERVSGIVVFHTEARTNIRADKNEFNLLPADNNEIAIPAHQVVAIDFVGGTPKATELAALTDGKHLLALRSGQTRTGKLIDLIGGDTVRWENENGNREDLPILQVARVYLNAPAARTVFNYEPPAAVAQSPTARPIQGSLTAAGDRQYVVDGKKGWTDTGLPVRAGQVFQLMASGEVLFRSAAGDVTGPGGMGAAIGTGFPLPSAPLGALIGRIGNGRPFLIGTDPTLRATANGRLWLGVNDNAFDDNSGFYTVLLRAGSAR